MKKILLPLLLLLLIFPGSAFAEKASFTKDRVSARVVGGTDAPIENWPWTVSLAMRSDGDGKPIRSAYWGHFCTGTLLTRTIVLTARHCDLPAYDIDVIAGRENLSQINRGQRVAVVWKEDINRYDSNGDGRDDYGGDLSLLRLAEPVRAGQPLGLGRLGSPESGTTRALGWGYTKNTRPQTLQTATLPRLPDNACESEYPKSRWDWGFHFIRGSQICAGYPEGGASTCMGDSGGPLMQNGQLVAVTSFGPYYCGEGGSGVYTRVDRWKGWIEKTVRWYQKDFWQEKNPRQPIEERAGWSEERWAGWMVTEGMTFGNNEPWQGHQQSVVLRANRPVREATISIVGDSTLCPGYVFDDYPNRWPEPRWDERCAQELPMKPTPGGEEVSWQGWNPDGEFSCPRIIMRGKVGGEPYQFSYRSCQVESLAKGA